ncbi:MAG: glutathione S-transferase family protein [Caulobacter sp.]|nr:glutathione S-transferase family protein [Caulobacter sp.]
MIFYYTPTTCSLASNIALEETGAAFEARYIRLWKPEDVAEYRKINPRRTIPALQIGETIFTENTAILYYLARSYPDAGLFPEGVLDQTLCLSLVAWFSASVHITRRQNRAPHYFTQDEAAQSLISQTGKAGYWENMQKIEALYAASTWLVAGQMTIADCYALLFYDWGQRDEFDMASLPAFSAFKGRMMARPPVLRALERHRSVLLPPEAAA